MNFLELCQAVVREGAIVGGDNKPETVVDQSGRMRLVVDWVNRANREVQGHRNDFNFRSRIIDFNVPAITEVLKPHDTQPDVEAMNEMTVSIRDADETVLLPPMSWIVYRSLQVDRGTPVDEFPDNFSIDPAGDIHFYPKSNKGFVFRAEFRLMPQTMVVDADTPWIPEGYRDVIFYKALMYFHRFDESPEQKREAEQDYNEHLMRLVSATTPVNDWNYTQSGETLMVMSDE